MTKLGYEKYTGTEWINALPVKNQNDQYGLLATGGFKRVSNNIVTLMRGYAKGWSPKLWNPFHGLNRHRCDEATKLADFCQWLESKEAVPYINHPAIGGDPKKNAQCYQLLFEIFPNATLPANQARLDRLLLPESKIQTVSAVATNKDAAKIHGILSIISSLWESRRTGSLNDRFNWILLRELFSREEYHAIPEVVARNQNAGYKDWQEDDEVAPKIERFLSAFWRQQVVGPFHPSLHEVTSISIKTADAKSTAEINLDREVPVAIGLAGFFGTTTQMSLRKYLNSMIIQADSKSRKKYDDVTKLLIGSSSAPLSLQELKELLAVSRGYFGPSQTTGQKLLNALLVPEEKPRPSPPQHTSAEYKMR
jgi:hypothetical protein